MKTKAQITAELKEQYPTLKIGNDEDGYSELNAKDYAAKIAEWADAELAVLEEQDKADAASLAKASLLERLGITAEEAALLLK